MNSCGYIKAEATTKFSKYSFSIIKQENILKCFGIAINFHKSSRSPRIKGGSRKTPRDAQAYGFQGGV